MKAVLAALAALLLVGCQGGDHMEVVQKEWDHCSANGTEKNLDKINVCLMNYSNARNARIAQANATSSAMRAASIALLSQNNQPAMRPMPMPQRTYCTTRYNSFLKQYQTYCN